MESRAIRQRPAVRAADSLRSAERGGKIRSATPSSSAKAMQAMHYQQIIIVH